MGATMKEPRGLKGFPEGLKFFIFRYARGENDYRCGAFAGESKDSIFEIPHIQELPDNIEIEIFEVTKEIFLEAIKDLKNNSTNFMSYVR